MRRPADGSFGCRPRAIFVQYPARQAPRTVCRPQAANQMRSVFCGGVYVAKNTSQSASVEFVRFQRTNYARGRLQAFCQKGLCPFLTVIKRAVSSRDSPLCMYFDEIGQEEGIKGPRFPPANSRTPPETAHPQRPAASGSSRHRPPSSARPPASAPRRRRPVRR